MKKVLIASLLILSLFLSLAACGDDSSESAFDPNSLSDVLLAHGGFTEIDFKVAAEDRVWINENGEIMLTTTATHEEVAKKCYDACKKAAQDGIVRDSDENPIDFAFELMDEIQFCYNYNDKFETLWLMRRGNDQEAGTEDFQLFWE